MCAFVLSLLHHLLERSLAIQLLRNLGELIYSVHYTHNVSSVALPTLYLQSVIKWNHGEIRPLRWWHELIIFCQCPIKIMSTSYDVCWPQLFHERSSGNKNFSENGKLLVTNNVTFVQLLKPVTCRTIICFFIRGQKVRLPCVCVLLLQFIQEHFIFVFRWTFHT